jgi:4-amino-4-deoxy-L-arabinose transferase-like glycosyltransferase
MTDAHSTTSPRAERSRWLPWLVLAVILLAQALYVRAFYGPALATPDDNGYWAQGSLIATTGRTWFRPRSDVQFIGMHWLLSNDGRYVSRYPPGLAVLVAAVYRLCGWEAAVLVNPVLAALALLGIYLLGRRLVGRWWALVPCALVACMPVFNQHALWCFAHMAVTASLVWGILFLAWWTDTQRGWMALLGGLLLGCVPTIRYPEAVFALGAAAYLLWDARKSPSARWHIALAALGAALPLMALLARNHFLFGSALQTGYALTGEQTGFGWSYLRSHAIPEFRAIAGEGVGPIFLLGVLGLLTMLGMRSQRRTGVLFTLLIVPVTLVYMAYYWGSGGGGGRPGGPMGGGGGGAQGLRFFLPTFPWYALAGVWLLAQVLRDRPMALRLAAGITLIAVQAVWGLVSPVAEFARLGRTKAVLADVTRQLVRTAQPGDVLLSTREYLDHLDFVRRWRLADLGVIRGERMGLRPPGRSAEESGRPSPMQAAKRSAIAERYADLRPGERAEALAQELAEWARESKVYFVGSSEDLEGLWGALRASDFKVVARVAVPRPARSEEADLRPDMPGGPPPDGTAPPGAGDQTGFRRPRDGGPFGDRLPRDGFGPGRGDSRGRPGRFGGGGPGGFGRLLEAKEIVIAEWNGRIAVPSP